MLAPAATPLAIAQSAQVYWVRLRRAMGAVLQPSEQHEAIWNEHEAIAGAIAPATWQPLAN